MLISRRGWSANLRIFIKNFWLRIRGKIKMGKGNSEITFRIASSIRQTSRKCFLRASLISKIAILRVRICQIPILLARNQTSMAPSFLPRNQRLGSRYLYFKASCTSGKSRLRLTWMWVFLPLKFQPKNYYQKKNLKVWRFCSLFLDDEDETNSKPDSKSRSRSKRPKRRNLRTPNSSTSPI